MGYLRSSSARICQGADSGVGQQTGSDSARGWRAQGSELASIANTLHDGTHNQGVLDRLDKGLAVSEDDTYEFSTRVSALRTALNTIFAHFLCSKLRTLVLR